LKEGPQDAAYKKNIEDLNKERRKQQTAENRQANTEIELGKANKAVETFKAEVNAHKEAVNALKEKAAAAKEYLKECEEIEKKERGLADL
jgi:hypothetical protein